MPSSPSSAEDDCPECRDQKAQAEQRAKATAEPADGLRLGECAPMYKAWVDCIERESGQAKACAAVLQDFKRCHNSGTERALQQVVPPQRQR